MLISAKGLLGEKVKKLLEAQFIAAVQANDMSTGGTMENSIVCITDSFRPDIVDEAMKANDASRVLLCFLSSRGLFVSSWLSSNGPCFTCFKRRWFSNLLSRDYPPDFERYMQRLDFELGTRSFPIPFSIASIAARLVETKLHDDSAPNFHWVNLISCEISIGSLQSIHGCECSDRRKRAPPLDFTMMLMRE